LRELLADLDITHLERRLPEGFDTQVGGESPHRFSSGERQLIGLARALLSSADLLVLDEPSATLDVDREARVVEVLRGLTDRTVLVVTHRPALLEPADQVLVLEEGVVRPRTQIEFEPEVLVPTEASAETVLERRHVQGQLAALAGALALNGVTP
jgi:ABC-type multidrug transport system fused ATPase/permease subunit